MRFIIFSITFLFALNIPKSFSLNFIQTISSNDSNLTYKGKLFYKNGEIFWLYTYPTIKKIWIKDKVYIYEPDLLQLTISKKSITIDKILKNSKKVKDSLYLAEIDGKKYYFIFDKFLKKLYYTDEMGNRVEIKFFNYSKNVSDSKFIVRYPQDIDIIYQTQ